MLDALQKAIDDNKSVLVGITVSTNISNLIGQANYEDGGNGPDRIDNRGIVIKEDKTLTDDFMLWTNAEEFGKKVYLLQKANLKHLRDVRIRNAESASHAYFAFLDVGEERTQASQVFENIRLATRVK